MVSDSSSGMMNVGPNMMNAQAGMPNAGMPNVSPMSGDIKSLCHRYMNYHVIAQTMSGQQFDGIIDGVDEEGVIMLIPEEVDGEERQFPFGRRRFRRFHRRRIPFPFLFPFLTPFPYFSPFPTPFYPGFGHGGF
jgi:hypothetical protein